MPQNNNNNNNNNLLDEETQNTVLFCSRISTIAVGSGLLFGLLVILPMLQRRVAKHSSSSSSSSEYSYCYSFSGSSLQQQQQQKQQKQPPPSLVNLGVWCLYTLTWMAIVSTGIAYVLIYAFGGPTNHHDDDDGLHHSFNNNSSNNRKITSSINFCEADFQDSPLIAETANTASSLGCYVPLALLGLFGPPSHTWRRQQRQQHNYHTGNHCTTTMRFALCYLTLLAIGLGSTALHALLTAQAQGGDELPMLWYCGAVVFCLVNVVHTEFFAKTKTTATTTNTAAHPADAATGGSNDGGSNDGGSSKLPPLGNDVAATTTTTTILALLVLGATVGATAFYVLFRDNFWFFYVTFTLYVYCIIFGFLIMFLYFPWKPKEPRVDAVLAHICLPMFICICVLTVLATQVWVSEMVFCDAVEQDHKFGHGLAPWIWNRVVHPLWHLLTGLLAWLITQMLIALHGVQQQWGTPGLRYWLAPYVAFDTTCRPAATDVVVVGTSIKND